MNAVQSPVNALGQPIDQQTLNRMLCIVIWEMVHGSLSAESGRAHVRSLIDKGAVYDGPVEDEY